MYRKKDCAPSTFGKKADRKGLKLRVSMIFPVRTRRDVVLVDCVVRLPVWEVLSKTVLLFSLPEKDHPCAAVMHISLCSAESVPFSDSGAFATTVLPAACSQYAASVAERPLPLTRSDRIAINMTAQRFT